VYPNKEKKKIARRSYIPRFADGVGVDDELARVRFEAGVLAGGKLLGVRLVAGTDLYGFEAAPFRGLDAL
jgi:hypothetical protein